MNTPKFVPGDKVIKLGLSDWLQYEVEIVSPNGDVKLKESQEWVWGGHLEKVGKASNYEPWVCMCGAESVKSPRHAGPYCPKWSRW